MNNLMRRSGIVAVLCMMLCLCLLICSCGGGKDNETTADPDVTTADPSANTTEDPSDNTTEEPGDNTTEPVPTTVTYTVTVKNAAGEALANVSVQLCSTVCTPGKTDASGVATFELSEDVYQAQITEAVEGYVVDTAKKYDFEAGATALTIVLEAVPTVEDNKINLRTDEDAVTDYENYLGEEMYGYSYIVFNKDVDPENIENVIDPDEFNSLEEYLEAIYSYMATEVKAGDSAVYVFEATADGYVLAEVVKGLGVKVNVKNVTTGATYLPLSGVGDLAVPVVAGNTYEITVEYTRSEKVLYSVMGAMAPDGTKDAPYHLYEGLVSTEVVIPEGETVWFYLEDNYLLIENPTVKVNVNGTIYAPNANGEIDMSVLEDPKFGLIGISSSVADAKVEIKLTGSTKDSVVVLEDGAGYYGLDYLAGKDLYVSIPMTSEKDIVSIEAYNGKVEAVRLVGMNTMIEEVVDTDEAADKLVVDASGYRYLIVKINAESFYVNIEQVAPQGASANNPFVIDALGIVEISKQTIDELTVMGRLGTECYIYYSYTATEACTITVTPSQIAGAVQLNGVDIGFGYIDGEGDWENDWNTGTMTLTLAEGTTVVFMVIPGAEQLASTDGMTITLAAVNA